jgi:hypothetical protein
MYIIYAVILLVLVLILCLTLKEEIIARKGITHGTANKYWDLREKRRYIRFQDDLVIRYNRVDSGSGWNDIGMKNISKKGVCISTYEKLKKKDMLDMEIEIPGSSKPLRLVGSVMWVKELRSPDEDGKRIFYTGLKFGNIAPESEAVLITHLNTLKRP